MTSKTFTIEGIDYIEKTVKSQPKGSSAYVYLPLEWSDKKVAIILLNNSNHKCGVEPH